MSKNPILSALTASGYIIFIVLVMDRGTRGLPGEDIILAPIAMISLFTLSAAVMGYVFLYQPGMLYMDGKKKAAADLFLKTVGIFAAITALVLILLFSGGLT